MKKAIALLPAALALLVFAGASLSAFDAKKAGFSVRFKNEVTPYTVTALFVMPGEAVGFQALTMDPEDIYVFRATDGDPAAPAAGRSWDWKAPAKPGLYTVEISGAKTGSRQTFNVFVMVPKENMKGESLNGFRIGTYPAGYRNLPDYEPPRGFIEVSRENENTPVSPHFRLKQFIYDGDPYPRYAVLEERLILLLESILEALNAQKISVETLSILSGYRSPFLNKAIGEPPNSRHTFGGAADIFVDERPKDWIMDDLNGDGISDRRDAVFLFDLINKTFAEPTTGEFKGGLAVYDATPAHGPFVHIDVRGFRARW